MSLKRIIMHWSAGGNSANSSDREHYHEIVEGDGDRVRGDKLPEANLSTSDGHYAAHVRKFNTGSIGLSMAGMHGSSPAPFKKGNSPLKKKQVEVFVQMVAEYADTYDIEITRETVLTHSEVPITHGIVQPGKWDITWLPGMKKPDHPIKVGDRLREMITAAQEKMNGDDSDASFSAEDSSDSKLADALAAHILKFLKSSTD